MELALVACLHFCLLSLLPAAESTLEVSSHSSNAGHTRQTPHAPVKTIAIGPDADLVMSASVATPLAGLPNHNLSSKELSEFTALDFDHMAIDRSHSHSQVADGDISVTRADDEMHAASKNTANEDRSEAVGNLLAALSSTPTQQTHTGAQNGSDIASSKAADVPSDGQLLASTLQASNFTAQQLEDPTTRDAPATDLTFPLANLASVEMTDFDMTHDLTDSNLAHPLPPLDHHMSSSVSKMGDIPEPPTPARTRIEYEAFGKLVFQDGNFYLNTYAIELGRDVHAFRAAIAREQEERQEREAATSGKSKPRSSGNRSHMSGRHVGSQVQGSIVSEAGGFAGVDDEAADQKEVRAPGQGSMHHSSQASDASATVKPHEVLMDPKRIPQFDYHKRVAEYAAEHGQMTIDDDDEKPAAVTEDHLPNPYMIPLIPIHGTMQTAEADVEGHKAISRRHVRISWNFQKDQWEMTVLGRNGAFLNGDFKKQGWTVRIDHGSKIQISHVEMTFCLPTQPEDHIKEDSENETAADTESKADDIMPSIEYRPSITPIPEAMKQGSPDNKAAIKISTKNTTQTPMTDENGDIIRGPDGKPVYKKRGPGRPPKNGIMSNRELKEREKARKAEEAKAANGGKTPPPPLMRGKPLKPGSSEPLQDDRSEKRKYKKRKRFDENGQPLPSVDGEDSDVGEDEERKAKKARPQREKSESPEYPAKETLTSEQLQRPTDPYATLLYKLLMEVWPEALALKQIYRLMKQKWPYFVHEVGTEGWQSSVRHNLNSEYMKLFDKGDKEGKGYAWKAIPNAALPQQDRKKAASQQAPPKPKPPQQPKVQYPAGPGQLSFHNTTTYPTPNVPQGVMSNGQWHPPGTGQHQNWQGQPQAGGATSGQLAHAQQVSSQQTHVQPGGPIPGRGPTQGPPQPNLAGQPPSNMPPPQPPAISGGSAPPNMPCTWAGIEAIKKFEQELMKQLDGKGPRSRDFWVVAFKSASRRCLHGATESLLDEGTTKEEETLVSHINFFVKNFANPNFRGFGNQMNRASLPTANNNGISSSPGAQVPAVTAGSSVVSDHNDEVGQPKSGTSTTDPEAFSEAEAPGTAKPEVQN